MLAIELPEDIIYKLFVRYGHDDTHISIDIDSGKINVQSGINTDVIDFKISDFNKSLIKAGGWVNNADQSY